jgi:hypothetical protein
MKISKKFGLIDILIVLVLVGGGILGVKMIYSGQQEAEVEAKTVSLEYKFETNAVGQEFVDSLEVGDEMFHSIKNEKIGVLKDFTVEPFKIEHRDLENGTIDMVESPENYRVIMEIEADGVIDEEEEKIVVGSEEIRVGMSLPVKSVGYATYGYIVAIEK